METVLITGCTGQDGSYLCDLLLEGENRGKYKVIGLTRRTSTDNLSRIRHLLYSPLLTLVEGDITDFASVFRIIQEYRPDYIYNLAAQSHVHTSFNQPDYTFQTGTVGVLNCLESIRLLRGKPYEPRFYQASSSEQFGNSFSMIDNIRCQNEFTPMNPQSPYAIAKLAAYHLTKLYRQSYGIHACNGILFNHEAPRRGDNFVTKKITNWLKGYMFWINKTDTPMIAVNNGLIYNSMYYETSLPYPCLKLGNLDSSRDWSHAKDMVRAMKLIVENDKPDDFVVGSGETHTIRDFLDVAFGHYGLDWTKFVVIDESLKRPSEVPYLRAKPDKIRELGWKPEYDFKALVLDMLENET